MESTVLSHANNEKWKKTNNGRNRTVKSGKNHNIQRKGKLQVLGNTGSEHQQASTDERKNKKEYLRRTRKLLETKLCSRNLIIEINTWVIPLVRYSGPFLKWTRRKLKCTRWQETNDDARVLTSEWWHRQTVYVKKKEEGESPTLKITWVHQYEDSETR